MAAGDFVTDPALLSVLQAAEQARQQSLAILELLEEYHSSGPHDATLEEQLALSKQQKLLNTRLAYLRGLNREAVMGVRSTKQQTAEARQEIDMLHLELQNLYYEQRHLRGEITGCEDYDHKYLKLPMIPVDEFLDAHSEHVDSTDHDLTIARIENEGTARKALHEQKEVLRKRKEVLMKETNAKKDELARLDADMEKWVGGHEAIKKTFDIREGKSTDADQKMDD